MCEICLLTTKNGGLIMLVLTRRIGEKLIIGDTIEVNVLGIKGSQVRLGTKAPADISVHREEVYNRIQEEKVNQPTMASVMPKVVVKGREVIRRLFEAA